MNVIKTIAGFAASAMLFAAAPAMAEPITFSSANIGQSYTLTYDGFADGTTIDGLTSSTSFKLTGISGSEYSFDYSVANTSSAPITGSRLSGLAFNTDPNIASATSTGAFAYTTLNSNYPNGIGTVDVCFKDAQTGSCAGGAGGGLTIGQSGTGSFTLSFSQPISSLTLSDFFVRYQSITGTNNPPGSASGQGTLSSTSTSSGGTAVPEPGMVALFASGLAGLVFFRRRFGGKPAADRLTPAFA